MTKKNYSFAFLYAIGSILIVSGHCLNGGINLAFDFFQPYYYHLALFVFASGYFYKEKNENNVLNYILKKTKRLIIPMYVINFICGLFVLLTKQFGFNIGGRFNLYNIFIAPITDGHQFVYNLCFWFVVPLFLVECFNVVLKKITRKISFMNEYIYFIVYLVLGIIALIIAKDGIEKNFFLAVLRFLYFLPYYELGTLYNRKLEKLDNMSNVKYFTIIVLIQLYIFTYNKEMPLFTPSWLQFQGHVVLPYIESVLGIAFWLRISKIFKSNIKNSKVINLIADNAYEIMEYQFLGFFIVKFLCEIGHNYTNYFVNFNTYAFRNDIWYYYVPRGINQWLIVYLVAGIGIPILLNKFVIVIRNKIFFLLRKNK